MFMTTVIKCLSLNFEIKLNCHVVGFDTGCHEAIITVSWIFFVTSTTVLLIYFVIKEL